MRLKSVSVIWKFALHGAVSVLAPIGASAASAAEFLDPLLFSTSGQGMWAPDKTQALGGTTPFPFNQTFPNVTLGDIVSTHVPGTGGTIPNPLWFVWKACIDISPIDPVCGGQPAQTISNPIPAQFIKNGAELNLTNMHLDFGLKTTCSWRPARSAPT